MLINKDSQSLRNDEIERLLIQKDFIDDRLNDLCHRQETSEELKKEFFGDTIFEQLIKSVTRFETEHYTRYNVKFKEINAGLMVDRYMEKHLSLDVKKMNKKEVGRKIIRNLINEDTCQVLLELEEKYSQMFHSGNDRGITPRRLFEETPRRLFEETPRRLFEETPRRLFRELHRKLGLDK